MNAIKSEAPSFFSAEEEAFEKDLANTVSFAFFHRRALGGSGLDSQPDPKTGLTLDERQKKADLEIKYLLTAILRRDGLTDGRIKMLFKEDERRREVIDTRKVAFGGWLVSNRRFHEELRVLRSTWESLVRKLGKFPMYPRLGFLDDLNPKGVPPAFRDDFYKFYRRWELDKMATWDWPVPMEPDLATGMLKDYQLLSEAGVTVFLPWYMLRDEKLNLSQLVQGARAT